MPEELSSIKPDENIPKISPLLNNFDLVLVQESWSYYPELTQKIEHSYLFPEPTDEEQFNPNGLARFSNFHFENVFNH